MPNINLTKHEINTIVTMLSRKKCGKNEYRSNLADKIKRQVNGDLHKSVRIDELREI